MSLPSQSLVLNNGAIMMAQIDTQTIINEVLSEDRNLDEVIPVDAVICALNSAEHIDPEKVGQLFKTRRYSESLFGPGFLDIELSDLDADEFGFLIEVIVNTTIVMFEDGMHPYDAFLEVMKEYDTSFNELRLSSFLMHASECEILAAIFYYCPLK